MHEIVHIQVGQCGNQIGTKFWELITAEHGIDLSGTYCGNIDLQLERANVYFNQCNSTKYFPRAVLVDLDPSEIESIKSGPSGGLFRSENMISGSGGAGNNFAKGHYTEGAEIIDDVLDVVRREAEACDGLQGFQIAHSLGGGTGSGLGTLLLYKLKEEYPDKTTATFSVLPFSEIDTVVAPYAATLSMLHSMENADLTFCFDNQALHRLCFENLKLTSPNKGDLGHLISTAMAGITNCFRFTHSDKNFWDMKTLRENMAASSELHFLSSSYAPLRARGTTTQCYPLTVEHLCQQMFGSKSMLTDCNPQKGHCLAAAAIFRGKMSTMDVAMQMNKVHDRDGCDFVDWLPNDIKTSVCGIPRCDSNMSSTFIGNTTAIKEVFKRIEQEFDALFRRKAYLHGLTAEGMDEYEYTEAQQFLNELISQYEECEVQ